MHIVGNIRSSHGKIHQAANKSTIQSGYIRHYICSRGVSLVWVLKRRAWSRMLAMYLDWERRQPLGEYATSMPQK